MSYNKTLAYITNIKVSYKILSNDFFEYVLHIVINLYFAADIEVFLNKLVKINLPELHLLDVSNKKLFSSSFRYFDVDLFFLSLFFLNILLQLFSNLFDLLLFVKFRFLFWYHYLKWNLCCFWSLFHNILIF